MYDLPSLKNVAKVVVDETVILGDSKPYSSTAATRPRSPHPRSAAPRVRRALI
jgi:ATP-dependent protease Clp ATPase subunit